MCSDAAGSAYSLTTSAISRKNEDGKSHLVVRETHAFKKHQQSDLCTVFSFFFFPVLFTGMVSVVRWLFYAMCTDGSAFCKST